MMWLVPLQEEEGKPDLSLSLSLPLSPTSTSTKKDIVGRGYLVSQKENFYQDLNLPAPWSWASQFP